MQLGLKDQHPYPRKTAALGALKIHDFAPDALAETEILSDLRAMLVSDRDVSVVSNCLVVLRELDGEAAIATKRNVYGLINRIKDFSEWSQATILEVVACYTPEDRTETFDIMNALEDRLQHANSAVVLATVKVFLKVTLPMADVHQQVFERLKAPLLTLAAAGSAEPAYAVWAHLHLLVTRAPPLFSLDFKSFFCRASDPPAVKRLKIEMLTAVADVGNTYDIVTELSEYVTDVDAAIARESVRAVGRVALDGDQSVEGIVDRLLQFVDHGADYVTAETLIAIKDIVRKHPRYANECISAIAGMEAEIIAEPAARAALVWLYGEFGDAIPEAPYAIESLLLAFEEEEAEEVRLELLTAAMKLFFKRPPEVRAMLGAALAAGVVDANPDVRDRAMMYARVLRADPGAARRVVAGDKESVANFSDDQARLGEKHAERIFEEFNTLSVLYRKPSDLFVSDAGKGGAAGSGRSAASASPAENDFAGAAAGGGALPGDSLIDLSEDDGAAAGADSGPTATSSGAAIDDLLGGDGMGRGGGGGGGSGANLLDRLDVPMSAAAPSASAPPRLELATHPVMDAATFQQLWGVYPPTPGCAGGPMTLTLGLGAANALPTPQPLSAHLAARGFAAMASGGAPPALKFFFYAAARDGRGTFLVEATVNPAARSGAVTMKTDADPARGAAAESLLAAAFSLFAA